jgi:hypothetical protein
MFLCAPSIEVSVQEQPKPTSSFLKDARRQLIRKSMRVRFSDDTKDPSVSMTNNFYDNMVTECCGEAYIPRIGAITTEEVRKMIVKTVAQKKRGQRPNVPKLPIATPIKAWNRVPHANRPRVMRQLADLVNRYNHISNIPLLDLVGKNVLVRNYVGGKFTKATLDRFVREDYALVSYPNETRPNIVELANIKPRISVPVLPQGGGNSIALNGEAFSIKLINDIDTFVNDIAATIIQSNWSRWLAKRDKRTAEMEEFRLAILREPATKRIQRWYKRWRAPAPHNRLPPPVRPRLLADENLPIDFPHYAYSQFL